MPLQLSLLPAGTKVELKWDSQTWRSAQMPTVELSFRPDAAQHAVRTAADLSAASLAAAASARMVDSEPPAGAQYE